jgi:hypothetical protein
MDLSPVPGCTTRLVLEVDRSPDGRLEGRVCPHGTKDAWTAFSGLLELLKALDEATTPTTKRTLS